MRKVTFLEILIGFANNVHIIKIGQRCKNLTLDPQNVENGLILLLKQLLDMDTKF